MKKKKSKQKLEGSNIDGSDLMSMMKRFKQNIQETNPNAIDKNQYRVYTLTVDGPVELDFEEWALDNKRTHPIAKTY